MWTGKLLSVCEDKHIALVSLAASGMAKAVTDHRIDGCSLESL